MTKITVVLIFLLALILPFITWYQTNGQIIFQSNTSTEASLKLIFPLFGLLGFSLIWLQIMLGAFMRPLYALFAPFDLVRFHIWEGVVAIIIVLLHPTILGIAQVLRKGVGWNLLSIDFVEPRYTIYIILGEIALILFLTAAAAAILRNHTLLVKNWRKIHVLQYAVFILITLHSLSVGSHTQTGTLRLLWYFYAITFLAALVYKKVLHKKIT